MDQEQEIIFYRKILLDETKSFEERRIAQKQIMKILNIKESNYTMKRRLS